MDYKKAVLIVVSLGIIIGLGVFIYKLFTDKKWYYRVPAIATEQTGTTSQEEKIAPVPLPDIIAKEISVSEPRILIGQDAKDFLKTLPQIMQDELLKTLKK